MSAHEPEDELARRLFDAARQERPDERVRARTKQLARSAGAGIDAVLGRRGERASWAPHWTAAALALAALALMWVGVSRAPGALPEVRLMPEPADTPPRSAAVREAAEPRAAQDAPAPAASAQPKAPPSRASERPVRAAASLADEIALLDQARSALRARDGARVLALVDRYERVLRGTRMRSEAQLLRIEALAQSGQRKRAAELAARFVKEHAGDPLADRARALSSLDDQPNGESR